MEEGNSKDKGGKLEKKINELQALVDDKRAAETRNLLEKQQLIDKKRDLEIRLEALKIDTQLNKQRM